MNNLDRLHKLGQSPWYDNISRDLLDSGEIRHLVQIGIRGMTSNPAIFKSAITSSQSYDSQLRDLIRPGIPATEIFEALAVEDIRDACDILRPIFDSSQHVDGFVSLEVSPLLASDTESTVAEAERLRPMVDRPNLFIKIPATSEGVPAIEECLYRGYPINITLIFSRAMYERVMEAYLSALERRAAEGKDIREVRSVASFFVSRVDTLVDKKLEKLAAEASDPEAIRALMGKAGVANAKLAYQDYKRIFGSERYQKLEQQGAMVQRPLWASTSTKNPAYPDTLYVDNLIGPDTVNTMPAETVNAFIEHGVVALTIEQGIEEAQADIAALEAVGISMDAVTQELLDEGVRKFAEPYEALLAAIDEKVSQMAAAD
jgi:transaldolase